MEEGGLRVDLTITPDAQLKILDLVDRWGMFVFLAILILVIYRKEIGALLLSFKHEHNADILLLKMNSSFEKNLDYFEKTRATMVEIRDLLRVMVEVQRELRIDLVRDKR